MPITDQSIQKYMEQGAAPPCISIFMPTHPKSTSQRINEDRIRLKNILQDLEGQESFKDELSSTHNKLVDLIDDSEFWLHQTQSLAIFANPDGFDTVHLPYELTPVSHTGDSYAISPLLIMRSLDRPYYLVDIDFKQPRLYAGSVDGLEELTDVDLPDGILDQVVVDGSTDIDDDQIHNVKRYLHRVAEKVSGFLGQKSAPLFVVGSPKWAAEFRTLLGYEQVLSSDLSASYDHGRLDKLHQQASNHLAEIGRQENAQLLERYGSAGPNLHVEGLSAVELAADQGKVETLFLPVIRITSDGIDSDDHPDPLIELPEDFATFDTVVRKVADQSGVIVPIEQTDSDTKSTMKAILRY